MFDVILLLILFHIPHENNEQSTHSFPLLASHPVKQQHDGSRSVCEVWSYPTNRGHTERPLPRNQYSSDVWISSYQTCSLFRWQDVRFLLRNAQSVEHRVNIKTKSEASWNRPLTSKCSVATLWLAVAIACFLINERAKTKTRVFTKPSAFTSFRLKGINSNFHTGYLWIHISSEHIQCADNRDDFSRR